MANQDLLELFKGSGPWAILFVLLLWWVLTRGQKTLDRQLQTLEALTKSYEQMSTDVKAIRETLDKRKLTRS